MGQDIFTTRKTTAFVANSGPHIIRVLADSGRLLHFRDYNGCRRFTDTSSTVEMAEEEIRRGKAGENLAAEDVSENKSQ